MTSDVACHAGILRHAGRCHAFTTAKPLNVVSAALTGSVKVRQT